MTRQVGTIPTTGVGGPDYEQIVAGSKERRGVFLEYGQTLQIASLVLSPLPYFSVFPWVKPPLAMGTSTKLIDVSTGAPTPYTVPKGYTLSLISIGAAFNGDAIGWISMDGSRILNVGPFSSGEPWYENKLIAITTGSIDPLGLSAHQMDFELFNLSGDDLWGSLDMVCILQEVGTPPLPTVKTVRCPWCSQEEEVSRETIRVTCTKCGKEFIVYDLSEMRRTP